MSRPLFLLLTLCLLSTFIHADADESTEPEFDSTIEKDTTTSSSTTDEPKLPIDNVYKRGLVVNHVIPKDIIDNHAHVFKDLIPKQFTGETLGYITPWNRRGMEIAIEHGKKFDYLSPVWYQIKVTYNKKKLKVFITGGHDADDKLLESLRRHSIRQMGHDPEGEMIRARIVPRFILEVEENIYGKVAENVKLQDAIINKVHKELEKHKYDGLVLEMTDAWAVIARNKGNRKGLNSFINRWGASLHNDETKRLLILVVRPFFPNTPYFAHADFMATYQNVDKFQIMTYDYSHSAPGPSSPINWMFAVFKEFVGKDNVENEQFTSKILLGLNWYGIDFGDSTGPKAVLGHEYVKILSDHPDATIQWVEDYGEHYTNYTKTDEKGMVTSHQVYYPSLKSLALRLSMATKLKLGVAIWELGQGLNYFLDLF